MKIFYLLMSLFCGVLSFSQTNKKTTKQSNTSPAVDKCSQHLHMKGLQQKDPARYATMFLKEVENGEQTNRKGVQYTIPVVFHVLHNNGTENISDAQINDALAILNRDYSRQNADADNVYSSFQGMPTNAEINFVFATVAPNGACFSGITRTVTTLTNNGTNGQTQVNAVVSGNNVYQGVWAHNKYLNIYVAKNIGGAAGYTFLPNGNSTANATNMYYNGIFMLDTYTGSIGTSSVYKSRALTHEVGHWLNLSHVWGDTNNPGVSCGDDYVSDTPITKGFTSCPAPASAAVCTTGVVENYENYMDYSYCSKMFTPLQVTRMRTALTSTVGGRNNIWTQANLNLVGGGVGTSLCALDFEASQTTMCVGKTVSYSTNTTSGISTYSWSFPGGIPSTSTAANPTVTYPTIGTYNASLTVTSSTNNIYSKSKDNYITIYENSTVNLPISEGFTSPTFPPNGWTIINVGDTGTWSRSTTVGLAPTSGNSLKFDNYTIQSGNDEIRLPKANLSSFSSANLVFDVAYAPYDANNIDGLEVLVSTDCGGSFTPVYYKLGTTLATASATTNSFNPTVASQWRKETIDLSSFVGNSSVWISFRNISGYGNNLYIDNINVSGTSQPAPTASFSSTNATICEGETITYTSTSTGSPTSYSWSFPGGTPSTSTVPNPVIVYSTPGNYNVSLTATNASGSNTTNQTNYVNVSSLKTPTFTQIAPICKGSSFTLPTTSSNSITGTWSPAINNNQTTTYTFNPTSGQCANSTTMTVVVNELPEPTITVNGNVLSTTQNYASYQWMKNNNNIPNANNATYTTTESGDYSVRVKDSNNCWAISPVYTHAFLGNSDFNTIKTSIYPNPVRKNLNISGFKKIENANIYDSSGKLVKTFSGDVVDVSNLPEGNYVIIIDNQSLKFIKK